jgi:hypothetical protein
MDHLLGKPERSVALYHAFVGLIAACGDYTVSPSKTTITFKGPGRGPSGAHLDGFEHFCEGHSRVLVDHGDVGG